MSHAFRAGLISLLLVSMPMLGACGKRDDAVSQAAQQDVVVGITAPGIEETKRIAQQAYIYGFPMIAAYKAMHEFNVDRASPQFKTGFNQVWNDSKTFTPKDTAIPTPNADTPYSMIQADLRAEPLVFCVPEVDKGRYFSVQLADLYSFNYGYAGSRTTGNVSGCYLVAGPNWKGDKPEGIAKVFRSETQFSLIIFRTQLFNAADIDNVKKVQADLLAEPLSTFLKQPAPPAAPAIDFLPFAGQNPFKTDFAATLDFLLQFAPVVAEEKELRAKFASIGIGPGKTFDFKDLSIEHKAAVGLAVKQGYEAIKKRRDKIGKDVNGWLIGAAFGDRAFFKGDYELRAAAALAGIYGNDAAEAMYPLAKTDNTGAALDGSKHRYTLTFGKNQLPPVNSFWSVTMYDGKTQLLIDNPINRYLINSPMLPQLKRNTDESLTLYIQKDSPGKGKEANWLPAPNGPIYMVMRLYWPKPTPPSILPPGTGSWKPPAVMQTQ
ncbi:DUF1254 domain-containing protein [Cyanobium sp. Morenito 9A2]|uniref:DUF1254 domain-containing protein n=1 Tax=Cyanobium sp. Morenito 9A2 TaxID=2823718 RepID=UPI0020CE523D|nr:DUF1254 domain-containing protein [Cyanobium sp. Morenito 9A2]